LVWNAGLEELLDRLNNRLSQPGMHSNMHLATRRFLELLRALGDMPSVPRPREVSRAVYAHDWPRGGWASWDWDEWDGYTPQIIEVLLSKDAAALHI
jgi:hypothetical protein